MLTDNQTIYPLCMSIAWLWYLRKPSFEALQQILYQILVHVSTLLCFQWKGSGEFINTRFFCRVCSLLHDYKVGTPSTYEWKEINNACTTSEAAAAALLLQEHQQLVAGHGRVRDEALEPAALSIWRHNATLNIQRDEWGPAGPVRDTARNNNNVMITTHQPPDSSSQAARAILSSSSSKFVVMDRGN